MRTLQPAVIITSSFFACLDQWEIRWPHAFTWSKNYRYFEFRIPFDLVGLYTFRRASRAISLYIKYNYMYIWFVSSATGKLEPWMPSPTRYRYHMTWQGHITSYHEQNTYRYKFITVMATSAILTLSTSVSPQNNLIKTLLMHGVRCAENASEILEHNDK